MLAGLATFVTDEVGALGGVITATSETAVRFRYSGPVRRLLALRTAVAVYAVDSFAVPRPKALLGEQQQRAMAARIDQVQTLDTFRSFRFSAAGRESAVFQRLAAELATRTGLAFDPGAGELLLRVHPADGGWEVLYRLSPRPLSARSWRLRDRPGALNATIAAAMVAMTAPGRTDSYVNLGCGTGTLLAERLAAGPTRRAVGVDVDSGTLDDASANLAAAGVLGDVVLLRGDAASLPHPPASFDVLTADLPYGTTMGSAEANDRLYPALLADAGRVAARGARFAVITHDIRRFESVLAEQTKWRATKQIQVFQKGHHPKVWLLTRT